MTPPSPGVSWSPARDQQRLPRQQSREAVLVFRDGSEIHLDELDEGAADAFRRLAGNLTRPEPD